MTFSTRAPNPGEADDHARARERHVLPGPGLGLLVARETADLGGERPGAARRAQPHIDVVERAVIGLRGQRIDQPLGQAGEILRAVERTLAVRFGVLVVEIVDQDQVEIGTRGHLAPAELAHGQHRGLLAAHMAVGGGEIVGDRAVHGADHRVGQPREGLARLARAVTVPDRMRTPIRNMYSSPNMRMRSSRSSS